MWICCSGREYHFVKAAGSQGVGGGGGMWYVVTMTMCLSVPHVQEGTNFQYFVIDGAYILGLLEDSPLPASSGWTPDTDAWTHVHTHLCIMYTHRHTSAPTRTRTDTQVHQHAHAQTH